MDRNAIVSKLKGLKKLALGLVALGAIFGLYKLGTKFSPDMGHVTQAGLKSLAPSHSASHSTSAGYVAQVKEAWQSIQTKVDEIKKLDEENQKLRLENAQLKVALQKDRFEDQKAEASKKTHEIGKKLAHKVGAGSGRAPASIDYKVPQGLTAPQLYVLGLSYFKAGENEKAAVILTQLSKLPKSDYKTARDYLMTGVAWYKVDHFKCAEEYFDLVLSTPESEDNLQYHAQARLWKALIHKKTGETAKTQHWLRELIDHHPHSVEAAWVNPQEQGRAHARH